MSTQLQHLRVRLFYIVTLLNHSCIISPLPTTNITGSVPALSFLQDDNRQRTSVSIPYLQISLSVIAPIIAIFACSYFMWSRWRRVKETKRRVKLAIQTYLSNDSAEPTTGNQAIERPPQYTRRSSQPTLPLQVVKEIDDVVYGRVSSTIERPAASFHPNQQEELPGYSTGPTTTNASNSTLTPYGLNNETSMLQT